MVRMASDQCGPVVNQRRFDPSMSRRTRRPAAVVHCSIDRDEELQTKSGNDGLHRLSLKELMTESSSSGEAGKARGDGEPMPIASAAEEKCLALVTKQSKGVEGGVKMVGMVGRYAKVLGHLINAKCRSKKRSSMVGLLTN